MPQEPPKVYRLSVRVKDNRGGPVRDDVSDPDGLARSDARHILILVHGFNNSRKQAEGSYAAMTELLNQYFAGRKGADAIAHFQWPGNAAVGPFPALDFSGYPVDVKRSFEAADVFAKYVAAFTTLGATRRRISLLGHSLGCRLILEAFERVAKLNPTVDFEIVGLMAPAVPVELVSANQRLEATEGLPKAMIKFHSSRDIVLRVAFPAGQGLAAVGGIEPKAYGAAVGLHGNPKSFGEAIERPANGHGDYWPDKEVAYHMASRIEPATPRSFEERVVLPRALLPAHEIEVRDISSRSMLRR
jgi:pimeloyl-ACP methyl ester carboxylesterase